MRCLLCCMLACLLGGGEADAVRLPLVPAGWELPPTWGARVESVAEGTGGKPCLRVSTTYRAWGYQPMRKVLYPRDIAKVEFGGRMRVQDVSPGPERWHRARAQLRFLTVEGEQVGGWPATTDMDGTHDWTPFLQKHDCPAGARVVDVWLGMAYATGTAWYEDLTLIAYDAGGAVVQPIPTPCSERTDTTGWWTFAPGGEDASRPLVIDFRSWMPTPAGARGAVVVRDGHLVFADGSRARFWGAGSALWCPPVEDSPRIAANLARNGINLVRFHGMDAMDRQVSIFDPTSERTDRLDPDKLARMDRHVANLRAAGIYIDLNLLTKRRYLPGDGVPDADKLPQGGKAAALFDKRLIELQKDYARLLLGHVNPHTGLAYKDDPAVALIEIVNETSMFTLNDSGGLPPSYLAELDELFTVWCAREQVQRPAEPIAQLMAQKPPQADAARFALATTEAYYQEMQRFLKDELGVKAPIIGTSYASAAGEKRIQAGLDVIDAHAYHDHPSGGWAPTSVFGNRSLLTATDNLIAQLARDRVAGMPFTVSEWNCVWSNEYIGEGPLLVAAYGGFQDWDATMAFSVSGVGWRPRMEGCWENDDKPHVMAASAAAALAFHRGDVAPGPERLLALEEIPSGTTPGRFLAVAGEGEQQAVLTNRFALARQAVAVVPPAVAVADGRLASSDGQIRWDVKQGCFTLDTPRTQAVLGFTAGRALATRDVGFTLSNRFGQVIVSSLDDAPLAEARRLLITATARAENTDQAYRLFKRGLTALGRTPILVEPLRATVTLRRAGSTAPTVHVLDWYGRRTADTVPVAAADGGWAITLGDAPGAWFEVTWP